MTFVHTLRIRRGGKIWILCQFADLFRLLSSSPFDRPLQSTFQYSENLHPISTTESILGSSSKSCISISSQRNRDTRWSRLYRTEGLVRPTRSKDIDDASEKRNFEMLLATFLHVRHSDDQSWHDHENESSSDVYRLGRLGILSDGSSRDIVSLLTCR